MPAIERLPAPACLDRPYPSSQKGGTSIVEGVTTLEAHHARLRSPDGYRPSECSTCGHGCMHAHDHRERVLRGAVEGPPVTLIRVYRCAACRAVWRVLPEFLARHLWRTWPTVAAAVEDRTEPTPTRHTVPETTRRRWRDRLHTCGRTLVQTVVASGSARLIGRVVNLGLEVTRRRVVEAFGGLTRIASLAALVHRLVPGVRVM